LGLGRGGAKLRQGRVMPALAAHAAALVLMFAVLPVWILAGFTDYLCHRAARIEQNSGVPESLLHLVQFALIGIPTVLALLLSIDAAFFLIAIAAILLHHMVAFLDVRYANRTREVPPFEQMVHSFLEILPLTALALLAVLHWPDFLALTGRPAPEGSFSLRWKDQPLPLWYVLCAVGAAAIFNALPYGEELVRCLKQRRAQPIR
jgi:hypothetical protein